MKFSDLAAQLEGVQHAESANALTEIQDKYLFDISGAEASCGGTTTGGSGQKPEFNAFCQWNMSF